MITLFGTLRGIHVHPITSVCIIPDLLYVASGDESGKLALWDLEKRRSVAVHECGAQIVGVCHVFMSLHHHMIVQLRSGSVQYFGIKDNQLIPARHVKCAELSFCRMRLFSDCLVLPEKEMASLKIVNVETAELMTSGIESGKFGNILCCLGVGCKLFVGCEDGHLLEYELHPGAAELTRTMKMSDTAITCLAASDSCLYVSGAFKSILCLSACTWSIVAQSPMFRDHGVSDLAVFGDVVVSCGWDGKLRVFPPDLSTMQVVTDGMADNILCADTCELPKPIPGRSLLDKVSRLMVTCGKDRTINLWKSE